MNEKDLEYWSRAMKLSLKVISKARERGSFNKAEILCICFSIRIMNSSTGIQKLLELGLVHDAKSLLRTMADALIQMVGALKEEEFMALYHGEELQRKNRIFKKMIRGGIWKEESLTPEQKDVRGMLKEELSKHKGVNLEELANDHNLKFEFYHLNNMCSSEVHHLPSTMAEYIEVDLKRQRVTFIEQPALDESQMVLCAAYGCVLKMADYLNDHFKLSMDKSIADLAAEGKKWFDKCEEQET